MIVMAMGLSTQLEQTYNGLPSYAQISVKVLAVLLIGGALLAILRRYIHHVMERLPRTDKTVDTFVVKMVSTGGWLVIVVVALQQGGVQVSALLGGLAIGGFIIGFALKDTLGNLAAGFMLLLYRPFDVDDTVGIENHEGEVVALGMALTTIRAGDGRIITIPNGKVLGGSIVNHTRLSRRRADVSVGIGYGDDIDTAVRAILDALQADPRVLSEPAPSVRLTALADSSVNLAVRPWVATKDFWQAKADFHGIVKRALDDAGIEIPFPQRVVTQKTAA